MEEDKNITVKVEQQEKVLFQDVCSIIEQGRQQAYANVGHIVIATYWNVGRRIVEEEQRGMKFVNLHSESCEDWVLDVVS